MISYRNLPSSSNEELMPQEDMKYFSSNPSDVDPGSFNGVLDGSQ
jgi:hypothetical protein